MKLYEIDDAIEHILATKVDENGEITDEAEAELDALELDREKVALSIAAYLKGELAESEVLKFEAQRLRDRATTHANRAERLMRYIASHLPSGTKIENEQAVISWRKSAAVVVDDITALPKSMLRTADPEPDKKAINEEIKAGRKVSGARIERRVSLQVR